MTLVCALEVCEVPETNALAHAIARVTAAGADALCILACDADNWTPSLADPALTGVGIPLFGGVFPKLIRGAEALDSGTLVLGLKGHFEVFTIEQLSRDEAAVTEQVAAMQASLEAFPSLIVLPDGLASNIERLVEELYSSVGGDCKPVGGGAGSLDFIQKPCLFSNKGMLEDAALIVATKRRYAAGVSHGWQTLEGPFLVTGAHGNTLEYLNYQPAFDVYRKVVEAHAGMRFSNHAFFDIAKTYPLGIASVDGDILVRDPLKLDGTSLVCVGDVPVNSTVYLLEGVCESLVAASAGAAKEALVASGIPEDVKPVEERQTALVFDCISRSLFLANEFDRELEAIVGHLNKSTEVIGALTLGEIGQSRHGPFQLLNKSTVIALFS
jgi:FIST N domain./FIST C domain.